MMMQCEFYDQSYTEVSGRVKTVIRCAVVSWYEALFR